MGPLWALRQTEFHLGWGDWLSVVDDSTISSAGRCCWLRALDRKGGHIMIRSGHVPVF